MKFKLFQIRWNEPLGREECLYAFRWVVNIGLFSIRVHRWLRSDDERFYHDHPFSFITIVLRGGYIDISPKGEDHLSWGSIRYREAKYKHFVRVHKETWTLLFCGYPYRKNKWGFWVNGKLKRPLKYFSKWGHSPCD